VLVGFDPLPRYTHSTFTLQSQYVAAAASGNAYWRPTQTTAWLLSIGCRFYVVQGHSKWHHSFDRTWLHNYSHSVVTLALSCIVSEYIIYQKQHIVRHLTLKSVVIDLQTW